MREYRPGAHNNNPRRAAELPAPVLMNTIMGNADDLARRSLHPPASVSGAEELPAWKRQSVATVNRTADSGSCFADIQKEST